MVGCSTGAWSPSEVIKPTSSFRQRGMLVALPPSILYFWDGEPVLGLFFFGMVRVAGCLAGEDTQMLLQAAAPGSSWYKSSASRLCLRGIQQGK